MEKGEERGKEGGEGWRGKEWRREEGEERERKGEENGEGKCGGGKRVKKKTIYVYVKRPHPPVTATSEVLSFFSHHQLLAGPER